MAAIRGKHIPRGSPDRHHLFAFEDELIKKICGGDSSIDEKSAQGISQEPL